MKQVRTSIYFDKRRQLKDGKYPLKYKVYYNGITKYFPTRHTLTEDDYQKSMIGTRPRGFHYHLKETINNNLNDFKILVDSFDPFSFKDLNERLNRSTTEVSLEAYYDQKIERCTELDKLSTAKQYSSSRKNLKLFFHETKYFELSRPLLFSDFNITVIQDYEHWYTSVKKGSRSSVSIHLKPLRHLYNTAIDDQVIQKDDYPFSKRGYKIPETCNVKKSVDTESIKQLISIDLSRSPYAQKARSFWLLMFYCGGIEANDIVRLKKSDYDGSSITFRRKKPDSNASYSSEIRLPINSLAAAEIKSLTHDTSPYLFGLVDNDASEKDFRKAAGSLNSLIRKQLKKLCKDHSITAKFIAKSARHSFATFSVNNGMTESHIGQIMGHSQSRTTKRYLAGLDLDQSRNTLEDIFSNF